jgi:SAM-dependent methyltransferase
MVDQPTPENLERTAAQWGEEAGTWSIGRGRHWFEVPAVRVRINTLVTGRPDMDSYHWLKAFMEKRGKTAPFDRVLTLGCGAGDLERGLFGAGFARRFEGIDVAGQAIERARAAAAELPGADIQYTVADINTIKLAANSYDLIFCQMSAHHFSDLEAIFSQVRQALKPGTVFFLDEYIGPKHFQWPAHQAGLIDLLLRHLPERWVRMGDGELRRSFVPPTIEEVVAVDPTEAIRSDEILPILARQFVVTECARYGGTLLHPFLDQIGINFVHDDPEEKAMLDTFFALEDWL